MKARREIADYMKNKRTERARIRVSGVSVEQSVLVLAGPVTHHVTTELMCSVPILSLYGS